MKFIKITALAASFTVFFPHFASAQEQCGPVDGMEAHFLESFGERLVFEAVDNSGNILALLVNDESGAWSLIIHDGVMGCMVSSGVGVNSLLPTGWAL